MKEKHCTGIDPESVILIGMPGSGKSSTGVLLAKTICYDFTDTDVLIQNREQRLLQNIIDEDGIDRFLDIEERTILSFGCNRCVIATGGSAVLRDRAMNHLKKHGTVVYLETDLETITSRIRNISTRGIALAAGQTLADLYAMRIPLYERYADITIECDGLTVEKTVERIVKALK